MRGMECVSITPDGPALEGVLGPLSASDEKTIRSGLVVMGAELQRVADVAGRRVGFLNNGLELVWLPSGQTCIHTSISGADGAGKVVEFIIELRPSWFFGKRSEKLTWEIESVIQVDCSHADYHRSMHEVVTESVEATAPLDAVSALGRSIDQMVRRVTSGAFEQWTKLGAV